jgi:hypothetical protein
MKAYLSEIPCRRRPPPFLAVRVPPEASILAPQLFQLFIQVRIIHLAGAADLSFTRVLVDPGMQCIDVNAQRLADWDTD